MDSMITETDMKKKSVLGILAHVDAGKTTTAEAMLYLTGRIKKPGRVDHGDCYLDNHALERERGITIFSKQAVMETENTLFTLLDTPGHTDFSSETERAVQVLDMALLIISGTDGIQAHTRTLWRLLKAAEVPCMVFVTKTDLPGKSKAEILGELTHRFGDGFVDFTDEGLYEQAALCSEAAMESFLEKGELSDNELRELFRERRLFPCLFGSGLRIEGVDRLLMWLDRLSLSVADTRPDKGKGEFAARVFKISRDAQGNRLTHVKILSGSLRVRSLLAYTGDSGEKREEKISRICIYSGAKFDTRDEVSAGTVCALAGLTQTFPGEGLGEEGNSNFASNAPILRSTISFGSGVYPYTLFSKLRQIAEEDPFLQIEWNEKKQTVSVQLMGSIQGEVFRALVKERFDTEIRLEKPEIMYRETICDRVEGVGHFEPLRHYAEVHLILEPLPPGSGVVIDSVCSEDQLDRNWQRLILTHLQEKEHLGVLTGSPVTDIRITLAAGKAHVKHTEGGDFRQATYRAVRQGLMQAKSRLLEPWYAFSAEVPPEQVGRVISDVRAMSGEPSSPETAGELVRIEGFAPVSEMDGYGQELMSFTHGRGHFFCRIDGYRPCHNEKTVVDTMGYQPERDTDNPADSVFCSHGAGVNVSWDKVREYMHMETVLPAQKPAPPVRPRSLSIDQRELEAIMEREFGPIRRREYSQPRRNEAEIPSQVPEGRKSLYIVDGYNVIFAWQELKTLAREELALARQRLMDMLCNFALFTGSELVLVFDGFRTPGNRGSKTDYHGIALAYTGENETADGYIEKLCSEIGKNYSVHVVTGDNLIRLSALHSGVLRLGCGEFHSMVEDAMSAMDKLLERTNQQAHTTKVKDTQRE